MSDKFEKQWRQRRI